jgi:muramoyltetrapeptide carboxypeptidase LdcA involved in peptidoglycan recycling
MKIFPEKLHPRDEIRVIAPSMSLSIVSKENIRSAIKVLENLGFKITFGKHVYDCDKFYSSSIDSRIQDLHAAFADPNVKAILPVIGGYNSNQLLSHIDYDLIRQNPKTFCGYSDITALQHAIYQMTGLVTYSGPHFSSFAMKEGLEYTVDYFKKILCTKDSIDIALSPEWSDDRWFEDQKNRQFHSNSGYWVLNEGKATGSILGGNLGTLQLLHGTPYMPSLKNSILFIEAVCMSTNVDVLEFDRDLQSLIYQPHFETVQALIIGRFETGFGMDLEKLKLIIHSKKELSSIPVIANVDFGHTFPAFTFPIGGTCNLEASSELSLLRISEH